MTAIIASMVHRTGSLFPTAFSNAIDKLIIESSSSFFSFLLYEKRLAVRSTLVA